MSDDELNPILSPVRCARCGRPDTPREPVHARDGLDIVTCLECAIVLTARQKETSDKPDVTAWLTGESSL